MSKNQNRNSIFSNITHDELIVLKENLIYTTKVFNKNELIIKIGDNIDFIGLVHTGKAAVEYCDFRGDNNVLYFIPAGDTFAEVFAFNANKTSIANVRALEESTILFVNRDSLIDFCSQHPQSFNKIIYNLIENLAGKNLMLSEKTFHAGVKTMRGKILSLLYSFRLKQNKNIVTLPFNRQEMADYLGVDRSALSKELCVMKKEGILKFEHNVFEVIQ